MCLSLLWLVLFVLLFRSELIRLLVLTEWGSIVSMDFHVGNMLRGGIIFLFCTMSNLGRTKFYKEWCGKEKLAELIHVFLEWGRIVSCRL